MPTPMGAHRKILFQCPEDLARKVDDARGVRSMAGVIREALEAWLEREPIEKAASGEAGGL